jgi:hypothetical protein
MTKKAAAVIAVGGVVAAASAVTAVIAQRRGADDSDSAAAHRWRVVTIGLPEAEVLPGGVLPPPLAELEDLIEMRTAPAPGGRGTELSARARPDQDAAVDTDDTGDDGDLPGLIRRALRESKQLLETGEIPTNEPQPEGDRPKTPAGLLTDAVTRRSPEEGVL